MTSTPAALWADYTAAHPEFGELPEPPVDQFGYSPDACDQRLALVFEGEKRTTADLLVEYAQSSRGMPGPGDHWLAADSKGTPQAVLRTVVTRIGSVTSADEEFAYDYAEGDRTAASWIEEHWNRFSDYLPPDTDGMEHEPVVFERFALVWPANRMTDADRHWLSELERAY